ncbi:glycoside hydrolase family 15 protein [Streptomyces sp. NPDC058195]|uniref:glycoside hydrolase family 15 protein n=1 Tax=Streptomyces sp. NPDC058195 TaxID=3346375 RepID=UPI0036E1FF87
MHRRIEDYALIGDMQTAALVCRDGSVDWLCLPRFDGDAVFAGMLGAEDHGFWRIGPFVMEGAPAPYADRRRYRGDSLILDSEWETADGTVRVTDFMPPRDGTPQAIRIIEGVSGSVDMVSEYCPRFGYGQHLPWIYESDGRTVAVSGPDALWLAIPAEAESTEKDGTVRSAFTVAAGDRLVFTLGWQSSHRGAPDLPDGFAALTATEEFWRGWVAQCTYEGPYREAVVRSLITLKALTYAPTGGIVAAPTTSLPEEIGGVRNWDYRFCWLRDSANTLSALLLTGYGQEAEAWRRWLLRAVAGDPERLQIMYGVGGEREMAERELCWLPGYENSRPVRIGNGAVHQLQLDVPGAVVETLFTAHERGVARCDESAVLIERLVGYVRRHWREPDDGIWEVRGGRRDFVHSKVMLWVAVDRAVRLVEDGVLEMDLAELMALRAEIHADVCARGFDPERNTFTQSYGSRELDAALLLIPAVEFLPPDDPRVVGTVDAVMRELATPDGLVHRYRTAGPEAGADGLPGDEGTFLLCSFWLVDALVLTGRRAQAQALFEHLLELRSDVGLLAEEYDPVAGRGLGNFPQAYSHLSAVLSAVRLAGTEREASAA